MMTYKCIFVTGKEGTGGGLIARTLSHVLGIQEFQSWDGCVPHISCQGGDKVQHTSLPYGGGEGNWPDVARWVDKNRDYEQYFVITTRDVNISEMSKMVQCGKDLSQVRRETQGAHRVLTQIMQGGHRTFIFSYETFMFLQETYLQRLYRFLGVESKFMPPLEDGNVKYLRE